MSLATGNLPSVISGYFAWAVTSDSTTIFFLGRGPQPERLQSLRDIVGGQPPRLAWMRQRHSATVIEAVEGLCGEGDALVTTQRDLALSVATADCLPIVLEGPGHIAILHAGWRGLVRGVIGQTLRSLPAEINSLTAWIGPAIGACCYEVGSVVADQIVACSGEEVIRTGQHRPHLDLALAARIQLVGNGIQTVQTIPVCTRCSPEWLWSYRREGSAAGRNWTFVWRS